MPSYRNKKSSTAVSTRASAQVSSSSSASAHVGDVCARTELPLSLSRDPVLEAMAESLVLWGDLVPIVEPQGGAHAEQLRIWADEYAATSAAAAAAAAEAALRADCNAESEFWSQPFAANMEMPFSDTYVLERLSDEEYAACMTWLYDQGWAVEYEDRACVNALPSNLPPRVWVSQVHAELVAEGQSRFAALAPGAPAAVAVTHHPVPGRRARAPRPQVTVQRFCRDSRGGVPCADPACRYVHADVLQCVNEVCGFDKPEEGKCCTGDKRTLCTRMHPSEGQVWSADLVVARPAA